MTSGQARKNMTVNAAGDWQLLTRRFCPLKFALFNMWLRT